MLPSRVTLVDVGPRDGLQNEKQTVDAAVKIELVHRLQAAGLKEIEVTSFVSPNWVPQMSDNAAVLAGIERQPGVRYSVLVPNMKGLDAALSAPRNQWPDEIVVFAAATEAF
ncbi:MAG TPA: hydroxymethylglutaryl-CoA lyase, partial [Caldimonas sp.]|nr:hydroxymethylglutaryl-CoA lyase [Caldimonas sp.]